MESTDIAKIIATSNKVFKVTLPMSSWPQPTCAGTQILVSATAAQCVSCRCHTFGSSVNGQTALRGQHPQKPGSHS